jgi:hypothetical protein
MYTRTQDTDRDTHTILSVYIVYEYDASLSAALPRLPAIHYI